MSESLLMARLGRRAPGAVLGGGRPEIQHCLTLHPSPDQRLGRLRHLLPRSTPANLDIETAIGDKLHEGG